MKVTISRITISEDLVRLLQKYFDSICPKGRKFSTNLRHLLRTSVPDVKNSSFFLSEQNDAVELFRCLRTDHRCVVSLNMRDDDYNFVKANADRCLLSISQYIRFVGAAAIYSAGYSRGTIRLPADDVLFNFCMYQRDCRCEVYAYIPSCCLEPFNRYCVRHKLSQSDAFLLASFVTGRFSGIDFLSRDEVAGHERPYTILKLNCSPEYFNTIQPAILSHSKSVYFTSVISSFLRTVEAA
jgi:hypothetical protein